MSGLADEDFMKRLNKVIFQAFFPILMFNNLYSIPEGMTLNLRLVAVAIISVLLLQAVLLAVVPRLVKENERRGVIIQAIYRSNFVLFGIPLATSVFGEEGTLLATMMVAIVIPVYNAPLAASCKNVDDLMQHYYDIVDNLNLKVLDFDIEGTWVADQASIERRNLAVKKVQDKWKSEGKDIAIWYTLPILPTGLTPEGMNVLSDAKAKGVELAGVNVMTMDYGNAICQSANTEGQNIHGKCATSAIANLHSQLKGLHPNKSDAEIDAMMGTTPMVGVNDVQGEVFYLSDARLVMQDAQKRNLGMVGIWSIARDLPGGTNLSPEFHGLTKEQAPKYAFSEIFAPFTKQ